MREKAILDFMMQRFGKEAKTIMAILFRDGKLSEQQLHLRAVMPIEVVRGTLGFLRDEGFLVVIQDMAKKDSYNYAYNVDFPRLADNYREHLHIMLRNLQVNQHMLRGKFKLDAGLDAKHSKNKFSKAFELLSSAEAGLLPLSLLMGDMAPWTVKRWGAMQALKGAKQTLAVLEKQLDRERMAREVTMYEADE